MMHGFEGVRKQETMDVGSDYVFAPLAHTHLPSSIEAAQFQGLKVVPQPQLKYKEVWQRAFVKIRANNSVNRLSKEIHLFGASTLGEDKNADMTQTDDIVRKMLKRSAIVLPTESHPLYIFNPNSPPRYAWSFIYFLLMIYTAFIMPFRLAFYDDSTNNEWFILDNVVNGLFFIDIVLTLNTAYYDTEGTLVTSRCAIFVMYLKSWLLVDLIACFPFTSLESGDSTTVSGLLRLMRLPRLYRLLRLGRIFTLMSQTSHSSLIDKMQELITIKQSSIRMTVFLVTVVLALHLMACIWFFVPSIEGLTTDTWVVKINIQDSTPFEQYISSLYWAMTTLGTVGYGDITPGTAPERIVAMIWMMFGVCFFSFAVSSLANVINSVDTKDSMLTSKLGAIDEFAEEAKLPKDLRFRLRHALRYSTITTGFSSQVKSGILTELPRTLRFEVAKAMHHGAALEIPFFAERDQAFISTMVPMLNSLQVQEQVDVYKEGDYADEVYFIVKGHCSIMFQDLVMKKLHKGSYFGEVEVIMQIPRKHTVQATLKTDLLYMNKKSLTQIHSDFPTVFEEMKEIAEVKNMLYSKSKERFKRLVAGRGETRSPSPQSKQRKKTVLDKSLSKTTVSNSEERLDDVEESVQQIRRMVSVLYEAHIDARHSEARWASNSPLTADPVLKLHTTMTGDFS